MTFNKLERLSLPRLEPTRVKHLSGATLKGGLLDLPTNIGPGWKRLDRDKHSGILLKVVTYAVKSFITLAPGATSARRSVGIF
jgi:hypothetical protein